MVNVFDDIKNKKDIDAYVVILFGILLTFLSIFDLADQNDLFSGILITLTYLIFATLKKLKSITRLHKTVETISEQKNMIRISKNPDINIQDYLKNSDKIKLLGISLFRFLPNYHDDIEFTLRRGGALSIVLVNPENDAIMELINHRSPSNTPAETQKNRIIETVLFLERWKERLPNAKIEYKLIDYLPPYSITVLEGDLKNVNTYCYAKLFPFRSASLKAPTIIPDAKDNHEVYNFFNRQFDEMWDAAKFSGTLES